MSNEFIGSTLANMDGKTRSYAYKDRAERASDFLLRVARFGSKKVTFERGCPKKVNDSHSLLLVGISKVVAFTALLPATVAGWFLSKISNTYTAKAWSYEAYQDIKEGKLYEAIHKAKAAAKANRFFTPSKKIKELARYFNGELRSTTFKAKDGSKLKEVLELREKDARTVLAKVEAQLAKSPKDVHALLLKARAYEQLDAAESRRGDKIAKVYEEVLKLRKYNLPALTGVARVALKGAEAKREELPKITKKEDKEKKEKEIKEEEKKARMYLSKAIESAPRVEQSATAFAYLAEDTKDIEKALQSLDVLIKKDKKKGKDHDQLLQLKGQLFIKEGKWKEAVEEYAKLSKFGKDSTKMLIRLCGALDRKAKVENKGEIANDKRSKMLLKMLVEKDEAKVNTKAVSNVKVYIDGLKKARKADKNAFKSDKKKTEAYDKGFLSYFFDKQMKKEQKADKKLTGKTPVEVMRAALKKQVEKNFEAKKEDLSKKLKLV